jgi:ketosteroid isomerase-like protein
LGGTRQLRTALAIDAFIWRSSVFERSMEETGEPGMPNSKYAAYEPAAPYFDLVRRALGDLVDGEHFFDIVTDDTVYEVLYEIAGWPRIIQGRANLMAQFRGYCDNVRLQSADKLITHKTDDGHVVIIEYEVHGIILATGVTYNNRFCSVITIEKRKIAHWRDYMDSLAAWNALTAKAR